MTAPTVLRYTVCGTTLELAVEDASLRQPLSHLFPTYQIEVESPEPASAPAITVSARGGEYVVHPSEGVPSYCKDSSKLLAVCEFALTQAFLAACASFVQLHASGAVVNGRAVLALGAAGAGKSSLALSWHRAGHPGLGDDVVFVDQQGHAHPFKRLYEVQTDFLAAVGIEPGATCLWEAGSEEAWYDPGSGAGWAEPAPVSTIAVARFRHGAKLSIEPLSRTGVLNALLHSQLPSGPTPGRRFDSLARLVEGAQAFEVVFGSAVEAAQAIAEHAG